MRKYPIIVDKVFHLYLLKIIWDIILNLYRNGSTIRGGNETFEHLVKNYWHSDTFKYTFKKKSFVIDMPLSY